MDRPPTMIKAIVIGLGLVIVGLTVLLVFGIITRVGEDKSASTTMNTSNTVERDDTFVDVAVALPAGARVEAMALEGEALSLLLALPSGAQEILTIDRRTGEELGTLELLPRSE
ncbi:MAG: hypothetical protein P8Q36_10365 [Alphaproteobacteria bacterium]|nr:hypothetical protein [Alphaproteobacteria bacterium]